MGQAGEFQPEKLVMAVLTARPARTGEVMAALQRRWGPTDLSSELIPFTYTDYYEAEMGPGLSRFFVSFATLVDPSGIAGIKKETNAIEEQFREEGGRRVNLDPGLLCLSRFTLVTTKESAHRIPLTDGIYAEVTLLYHKGSFQPLEWTYPDYRTPRYLSILNSIRSLYKAQVHPKG